ncbi:hypothetical protein [Bacillus sp. P14.5]|uniref:hypothetical protein n=1 Tax=Bacillus sp. P14.5 TaxID=1983400 RepID=UPI0013B05EF6|nr:hypothetical protein [Bacillus sp. P14.5]
MRGQSKSFVFLSTKIAVLSTTFMVLSTSFARPYQRLPLFEAHFKTTNLVCPQPWLGFWLFPPCHVCASIFSPINEFSVSINENHSSIDDFYVSINEFGTPINDLPLSINEFHFRVLSKRTNSGLSPALAGLLAVSPMSCVCMVFSSINEFSVSINDNCGAIDKFYGSINEFRVPINYFPFSINDFPFRGTFQKNKLRFVSQPRLGLLVNTP